MWLLRHVYRGRFELYLSWSHTLFILLHNFARIRESWAITSNARAMLQLFEHLLVLFTVILIPSLSIAVFPVTSLASLATNTTALIGVLLAAPLLAPVVELAFRALIVALGLLLLLVFLFLLLTTLVFSVEFGCFLVTIADKELLRLLKIYDVSATFKVVGLGDHIIKPEFDGLFFILDCE